MSDIFAGIGRKHPQLNIPVERLHLDPENPRLPEEIQGKKEEQLLKELYQNFSLLELAESMSVNGYLDEEPLVAIPKELPREIESTDVNSIQFINFIKQEDVEFTVVEGNRRLATVKILLNSGIQNEFKIKNWPQLSTEIKNDLSILPVIIYKQRQQVVPYLGVRHITGIQKWDSFAKARYIATLVESGSGFSDIEQLIPDKTNSLLKNYISYKILEQANDEFNFNYSDAKNDFSLLLLSIGQGNIKRFIGLPEKLKETDFRKPIPNDKLKNLELLLVWLFGNENTRPVINESRDITNYISHIVGSLEAIEYLQRKNDLLGAYDRTDGEEKMVLKYLSKANINLETVLSVVHRHKTNDVIFQSNQAKLTIEAIIKLLGETND